MDSFDSFANWALSNGYDIHLSIDRTNNDKGYSPDNCKWSTTAQQAKNRRTSILVEWNGQSETLNYWSKLLGIDNSTLSYRYHKKGLRPPELFNQPR
jgi:hypothetical protein